MKKTAYLSLGSNLGDRLGNLERAIRLLASDDLIVKRRSSIYKTEPRDLVDQPWFLNMVVEAETRLFPKRLLWYVRRIENQMGRRRVVPKGPRTIDIDIVLFGHSVIDSKELAIPHPRMQERRFVLEPLSELSAGLCHPVTNLSIREMLAKVAGQKSRRLKSVSWRRF
jgi:2-amino-4-hydroxy-6-hydroxymethyldihydropteridine diphosphokinase